MKLSRTCGTHAVLAGLLAGSLALFCTLPAHGQSAMAAVTGTVTDSSGAVIPGAKVAVTNQQQGTTFNTTTNADGLYNLPRVPTGSYTLEASANGFQTTKQGPFTLVLNQTAQVNVKLAVGQVSQTVSVTGQAPLLQTETTETSTNLNAEASSSLPLVSRNYVQLTTLSPGAVTTTPSSGVGMPFVNGNRQQANNFLLGGTDNNQTTENGQGYTPTPDAIQEFTLITNNASAEFGNFQGGIITVAIKSGTNHWHGDLWEYLRNDKLNANAWANNWGGTERPKIRWNDFGGTAGGPIIKNKLFVFGDYNGNRNDTPTSTTPITVFTAAERGGDFGSFCTQHGGSGFNGAGLCVDSSGALVPAGQLYAPNSTGAPRTPFANNIITTAPNPVAAALFNTPSLYPAPVNTSLQNNALNTTRTFTNTNQGDVRVDYNIRPSDRVYWRGSMLRQNNPTFNSFPLLLPNNTTGHDWNSVLDWTHSIGGTFVNDAKLGLNYVGSNGTVGDNGLGNIEQTLGIAGGNARGPGLMLWTFTQGDITNLGNADTIGLRGAAVITYEDQMIITEGRHLIHTGFQGMRYRDDYFYGGNNGLFGSMDFDGQFTGNGLTGAGATPGSDGADFFLGLPSRLGRGPGTGVFGQRRNVFGVYIQDDWHATQHFTLNAGLRYQNFRPLYEQFDRQLNVTEISGVVATANSAEAKANYKDARALYNPVNGAADFQPRLGFTWSPFGNTVVRGAYGISTFMEGTGLNLRLTTNPPSGAEFQANYNSSLFPATTTDVGLSQLTLASNQFKGVTLRVWSPVLQPAVTEQWSFNVQRQLSNSTTVQVGYVGQHGTHLVTAKQLLDLVMPVDCMHAGGTSILTAPCSTTAPSPSPYLSGNPTLASDISNVSATYSDGVHIYHALQAVLQRRFANGLQYQGSYTWSKCMSDSGGFFGAGGGQGSAAGGIYAADTYDTRLDYGQCFSDITHLISSYVIYQLPFGTSHGPNLGNVGNYLLGNWQLSATWNWHTGFAMSPTSAGVNFVGNNDFACCRLNCNSPVDYIQAPVSSSFPGGVQWFSPASFSLGTAGNYPTCGRGVLRGPKLDTVNLSVARSFPVGEARSIQFRADFNNLTNTPILNVPTLGLGPNLGQITSAQGARQIEFALKFYY